VRGQENSSFANFGRGLACAICKCAVLCGGVSFFFARGEKKQNKFPSNCTAFSTEYQSNQSVFCDYFNQVSMCRVGFSHLLTTACVSVGAQFVALRNPYANR
jgi:hypothetical protein